LRERAARADELIEYIQKYGIQVLLRYATSAEPSHASLAQRCAVCGKLFKGEQFLNDHISRRHPHVQQRQVCLDGKYYLCFMLLKNPPPTTGDSTNGPLGSVSLVDAAPIAGRGACDDPVQPAADAISRSDATIAALQEEVKRLHEAQLAFEKVCAYFTLR